MSHSLGREQERPLAQLYLPGVSSLSLSSHGLVHVTDIEALLSRTSTYATYKSGL